MRTNGLPFFGLLALAILAGPLDAATGDPERGKQLFRVCTACHTVTPGWHRTGPSLGGVWGRKAGSLADFSRYSPALKQSGLVWNAKTLDAWLANPERLVPGTTMGFRGIEESQNRADLVAYLEETTSRPPTAQKGTGHGMPDLKQAPPEQAVQAIRHCGDSYRVTTQAGEEITFWEYNLRFKTDSSPVGPNAGRPVLVSQGMMGDRAQVVFASPAEISRLIKEECGA